MEEKKELRIWFEMQKIQYRNLVAFIVVRNCKKFAEFRYLKIAYINC